jgi:hypothetical protein
MSGPIPPSAEESPGERIVRYRKFVLFVGVPMDILLAAVVWFWVGSGLAEPLRTIVLVIIVVAPVGGTLVSLFVLPRMMGLDVQKPG